jgi:hypothetical protein
MDPLRASTIRRAAPDDDDSVLMIINVTFINVNVH